MEKENNENEDVEKQLYKLQWIYIKYVCFIELCLT